MSRQLENQNAPRANSRGNVGVRGDEFMTKTFLSTCAVRMIVSGTIGFGYDIVALGDNE
jgi:hypothetical protein